MRIESAFILSFMILAMASPAWANDDMAAMMAAEHGDGTFHMFRAETDYGIGKDGGIARWDVKGWVGGDDNKIWLKTEGAHVGGKVDDAEFWALYSCNISTFWDAQVGIRYDAKPTSRGYATIGFNGLASYFFETEAHLFISDKGDVSARLREENDFLLTQKLIVQPYAEINLFAQNVPERDVGAGVSDAQIGIQTRYEFSRTFAPYVDVHYGRLFGETESIARRHGKGNDDLIGAIGLRLMF